MAVVTPPRTADTDERTLDERVAELEALIEEARQRTRRRRRRNAAVALAVLLAAGAAVYAGGDGFRVGTARSADGDPAPLAAHDRAGTWSVPTGPPGFGGSVVLHPTKPSVRLRSTPAAACSAARTVAAAGAPGDPSRPRVDVAHRRPAQRLDPLRGHERRRAQEHRRRTDLAPPRARTPTREAGTCPGRGLRVRRRRRPHQQSDRLRPERTRACTARPTPVRPGASCWAYPEAAA